MANAIIQIAIREGASDIHVERNASGIRILYRIDGALSEIMTGSSHVTEDVVARFKTMAELDLARQDFPQQGTIHLRLEGTPYELRVSVVPIRNGEKLVIRIPKEYPVGLSELGFLEDDLTTIRSWMARRSGLILVSGSTDQGKTATSLNLAGEIIGSDRRAIALQHPLDQVIPGVTSFSVDVKSGMMLEAALDMALREQAEGRMKPFPLTPELLNVARRVVWFKKPVETLADPIHFLAHVMTYGTISDLASVKDAAGSDIFREALDHAPPGIFDARSWAYWNLMYGRAPAPPLPVRFNDTGDPV